MPSILDLGNATFFQLDLLAFVISILFFMLAAIIWYTILPGHKPEIRRMGHIDTIDELIGSASERGKPVLLNMLITGSATMGGGVSSWNAFNITMKYIAKRSAELNTAVYGNAAAADSYMMMSDYARQGFVEAGHPERYVDANFYYSPVRWLAWPPPLYAMENTDIINRIDAGTVFRIGPFDVSLEWGSRMGAINYCTCDEGWSHAENGAFADHFTIGDEPLAVAAYISEDDNYLAVIIGEDWMKLFFTGFLIVGAILSAFGIALV
jgi:hypothetical protein